MKIPNLLGVVCACILIFISTTANASLVTPAGLNPGDTYQLVFVTRDTTNALSSQISTYNTFAQAQAELNPELTGTDDGVQYKAIASTPIIDALDNALVEGPVYKVNDGGIVAVSLTDFWDGTHLSNIRLNQFAATYSGEVWTGTGQFGEGPTLEELGAASSLIKVGLSTLPDSRWISYSRRNPSSLLPLYALSSVITVANVPIPATMWLFGSGLLGLIGVARKKAA